MKSNFAEEKPLVSIIMPAFNAEKTISQSIYSVLNQEYFNFELLIIDDLSTDNTKNIIKNFSSNEARIKPIFLNQNIGAGAARNEGIKKSTGRYIAFLDADDLWKSNKLNIQINYMIDNNVYLCASNYSVHNSELNYIRSIKSPNKITINEMHKRNQIGCLTGVYDTKFFGKQYMPKIRKRQDYAFWIKLINKSQYCFCIQEDLAMYRISKNSLSSNKFKLILYNYIMFRKELKYNVFLSIFYTLKNVMYKFIN